MTALTVDRFEAPAVVTDLDVTLASGTVAFKHAAIGLNLSTGKAEPMSSKTGLLYLGKARRKVDASTADKLLSVHLPDKLICEWWANAGSSDAVAAANIGNLVYFLDDTTVTITSTSRSVAGIAIAVDTAKGVLVAKLNVSIAAQAAPNRLLTGATIAFTDADIVVTSGQAVSSSMFDVPTSAANSTITLPVTGVSAGTILYFKADGTKNGHTVQYRYGTTAITTALTASKKHLVICVADGAGAWNANAYVSP